MSKVKEFIRTSAFFIGRIIFGNRQDSKILYYHDFHNNTKFTSMSTSICLFQKHLKIIQSSGYLIVDKITKSKNQIMIMLDDGIRGIWDCKQFFFDSKINPTICIAKGLVGKEGYLTEEEIKYLDSKGWHFISHTVSHTNLNDISLEESEYELSESKRYLENLLGHEVDAICAPKGRFNNRICEYARQIGYKTFYSSIPGNFFDKITDYDFVRTRNLCQFLTPLQFKFAINGGGYKIFQQTYFKRRYIII